MENKSIGSYNSLKLDYYHPDDKYHFMFTQIPDFLFEDPVCQKLSNNAKLLFGKMLRETRLAAKKGNIDTDGHLYIDFSLSQTCKFLNCSEATAKRIRKELRDCFGDGIGLVQFVSHGQGRPDYVYVMNYIPATVNAIASGLSNSNPRTIIEPSREVKNEPSREIIQEPPRELKSEPHFIENNKESLKKDNIYHLSFTNPTLRKIDDDQHFHSSTVSMAKDSTPDRYVTAIEDFKIQIGYDQMLCYASDKTVLIDDMVEVMAQEYISRSEETIINGRHYSRSAIRDCLKSIDLETAKYVLDCLCRNNTKIINIQRYILATLLNAPASFKTQKAYDEQTGKNIFLRQNTRCSYTKTVSKKKYEPYHGRDYTEEEIHAFELKKLGITG
ncbi:MAG: replication initiator protein A [Lachnospiraceae bacterium]|nr:replication initiator protein A [Lachnospiraceae bacterium]